MPVHARTVYGCIVASSAENTNDTNRRMVIRVGKPSLSFNILLCIACKSANAQISLVVLHLNIGTTSNLPMLLGKTCSMFNGDFPRDVI